MIKALDFFSGKRVFITGSTGFKGSWLSFALARSGAQVTGYVLPPHTEPNLFTILGLQDRIKQTLVMWVIFQGCRMLWCRQTQTS